ncbi:HEXXH motif domain-containing protein [Streptomyces sp. NPDC046909]|uniref:HEXXH motif domain-containing protein n=1 Tax=Streptomyces sp. NPDC046909 TaxID=3155617 RepID=UPI0033EEACCD
MRLHHLSASVLRALISTTEDQHAVTTLVDTETSRRLLMMRAIMDVAARLPEARTAEVTEAWSLLESVERVEPEVFREVLLDPQVGLWGAALFRRLFAPAADNEAGPDEAPLWVEFGFLGQLAATVAVVAGVDFRIRVPVRSGAVFLPGLGQALVGDARDAWGSAEVRGDNGVVEVAGTGPLVTLPAERETDAPGWQGLRRLRAVHDGVALSLVLDDLGPRAAVPLLTAGRLTDSQFRVWQRHFDRMWAVLVDDHRANALALSKGLRSIVPLPRGERLRARAASSSDAFGCVLLSDPDPDEEVLPAQLGVALVHEFRHTLLNGLIFLVPLFEDHDELFHAPWRDDPRPLGGLVHGAYAFSGVTHYWHTRGQERLAGFEFALWRDAVREVLGTLGEHPALTDLGREVVRSLSEQSKVWEHEQVGAREAHLARLAAVHHHATWRAHHLYADPSYIADAARAWSDSRPAPAAPALDPVLRTDPHACRLDTLALLARLSLINGQEFDDLRSLAAPALRIPGAGAGDLALVDGDVHAAVKLYADELAEPDPRPAAWAGLGLALTETGEEAAGAVLIEYPERVAALSRALRPAPDPVALARWLAG